MANENKNNNETAETITGMAKEKEGVLVYLIPLLGLIFAIMKDKKVSDLARFNYNQAATIFIINIGFNIVLNIVGSFIPYIGYASYIISLLLFVFSIIALVKTYNGERYEIPVVYDLSKSIWGNKED